MKMKKILQMIALSLTIGALSALSSAVFLTSLNWVRSLQTLNQWSYFFLPLGGVLTLALYQMSNESARGNNLILDRIYHKGAILPWLMAPLVFLGTLITHLLGGSAGRESTAVQMSAGLTDQLQRWIKLDAGQRQSLLTAGIGAGFATAIGTPLAGVIFSVEVLRAKGFQFIGFPQSVIACFSGYYILDFLNFEHYHYPSFELDHQLFWFLPLIIAAFCFGLLALLFCTLTQKIKKLLDTHFSIYWHPIIAGVILILIYSLIPSSQQAQGLGLSTIKASFSSDMPWWQSVEKLLLTSITIAGGFKGGEFTPLVYIGSTAGSFLSTLLPLPKALLCSAGFAAVFAAASRTPLACAIMCAEIFGAELFPYALFTCFLSYLFCLKHGLYQQR